MALAVLRSDYLFEEFMTNIRIWIAAVNNCIGIGEFAKFPNVGRMVVEVPFNSLFLGVNVPPTEDKQQPTVFGEIL